MGISKELSLALIKGEQLFGKDADSIRASVEPGEYDLDTVVRIRGKLVVAPDTKAKTPTAVPWQKVAALLFSKLNGVTVESVLEEVLSGAASLAAAVEEVDARAKEAVERLVASTEQPRKGAVKLRAEVEELVEA